MEIDDIDREILEILQENGRIPISKIAKKIGKPRTTIRERITKLEEEKYILGYRAIINPEKIGFKYLAIIMVKVRRGPFHISRNQIEIAKKIINDCRSRDDMPYVEEAHIVTGVYDIALKVWVRSWDELSKFLIQYLASLEEIDSTETFMVLEKIPNVPHPFPLKSKKHKK